MSETRQPLALSLSFSGSPSTAVSRPLKRRLTTNDANFFTSSATSFKPRPYAPNGTSIVGAPTKPSQDPRNYRSVESLAIPTPIMDPTPDDPNAVFIHPPFTNFPDSHLIPDGLSYALMAENPNWFLDPYDYKSANSTNPKAIPYPPQLEPPRGWCPAKKRDLKNRGADGWPEGEEPRLRCTFCRRTYAGVNAKSMWRRHVFEKHKIAMANRRDGSDRPRGRGSNSTFREILAVAVIFMSSSEENRQTISHQYQAANTVQSGVISLNLTPQYFRETNAHTIPKFRTTTPLRDTDVQGDGDTGYPAIANVTLHPAETQTYADVAPSSPQPLTDPTLPPITPPLTPRLLHSSESSDSQSSHTTASPIISLGMGPPSPYDPLLTPSFRHSPLSLSSGQPWKFPSPSHPLHSREQDLCLTMLGPVTATPITKHVHLLDASPPSIGLRADRTLEADIEKLLHASPQTSLFRSRVHVSVTGSLNHERSNCQMNESPLSRNTRMIDRRNRLTSPSKLAETWSHDNGLFSSELGASRVSQDPFEDAYGSWLYTMLPTVGVDSPVLRSGVLPGISSPGLGVIGTHTAPFASQSSRTISDEDVEYFSPLADDESEGGSGTPWLSYISLDEEPTDTTDAGVSHRPQKRRRTID